MEMASSVEESAANLMLETDPSARQPRASYQLVYQVMAHSQLEKALSQVDEAAIEMGEAAWQECLRFKRGDRDPSLGLLVADSRLARDQLAAAMK